MRVSTQKRSLGSGGGFFVVAGLMGRGVPFFSLECEWENLLAQYGLEYFKASECENGWKQFSKFVKDSQNISASEREMLTAISLRFIGLIANPAALDPTHYLTSCGIGVLQEDFYQVIKDPDARAVLAMTPIA